VWPAVTATRPHVLTFWRHHANIGLLAAVIAEAVEAEPIVEMPEQDDMVLERDVGTSSATAAATAAAAAAATAAACARATTAAPPAHARVSASGASHGAAATAAST